MAKAWLLPISAQRHDPRLHLVRTDGGPLVKAACGKLVALVFAEKPVKEDTALRLLRGEGVNVLDLFSGIGGFSLGLERAGMRTVAFCEIEPFCRAVLRKHWPHVPIFDDVRTLTGKQLETHRIYVDVICGGFPCQDISNAGKRAGIDGERSGLWSEYARLIRELRPSYVIVENVAALLGRGIGRVLGDLAALGYDAEWHCIPACRIGAPIQRDRVWIVASPNSVGRQESNYERLLESEEFAFCPRTSRIEGKWWMAESEPERVAYGVPNQLDRLAAIGNSVVPQIPEIIGRAIMSAHA